ncbi:MAG: molecular chaperone [Spirochaetaceae bacterium]|nr:MAG: molecular chaperone [Spirochaetaceae bacterium]
MKNSLRSLLIPVLLIAWPAAVWSFQLTPMSAVIDLSGSSPTTTFEVTNPGNSPVAIELRVATRRIDPDGTELNEDASDQIQLFPSQLVLRRGASQTVRARWIGQSTPERELPFRVTAEQLPINLNRGQTEASGLQFMLRYRATLYVRPPGTAPDLEVLSIDVDDPERVTVNLRNNGTRHQLFFQGAVILEDGDGAVQEIDFETIDAFLGVNVLPGEDRRVRVPRDQLPFEPASMRFRFN